MSSSYPIPGPAGEASPPPPIPAYTLFNAESVGLATFLGTPIAGSILMAVNYRRLGKGSKAAAVLVIALLVTALALWLGSLMPQGASAAIALVLFFGATRAAKALQGAAVEQHRSEEHTSELQSLRHLVCRLLLEKMMMRTSDG